VAARAFRTALERWYERTRRDLPWRATRDPYRILVSEIMLQQTRAQAVVPYYHRFLERFPDADTLALAPEAEVLACWSGLGYYARARNLLAAAREIAATSGFPGDYDSIRALPGVGPYTAAAVASIAFDQPHAVVDGNVMRVIARLRNDGADIASARTRARFQQLADDLLDRRHPGRFNQALMELGATICLPRAPECPLCPVARFCEGRKAGRESELPVKRPKRAPERMEREVAIVEKKGSVLMRRRSLTATLMPGFWELPGPEDLAQWRAGTVLGSFRHTITHHHYTVTVLRGTISRAPVGLRWLRRENLDRVPVSTIARKALRLLLVRLDGAR